MAEWSYPIVVPALVLRDLPGERQTARIGFDPPLDLGGTFSIEFWFRTEAFPRGGPTPVLVAELRNIRTGLARDLILGLDGEAFTAELQNFRGAVSDRVPLNQWNHITLAYQPGELRVACWRAGMRTDLEGKREKLQNESYRLISLALASENAATHLFAELRLYGVSLTPVASMDTRDKPLIGRDNFIGYWKLDEGSGDLMVDSSVRGNDGVIAGGTYRLDSGLALQIGRAANSPPRNWVNGRSQSTYGRTAWLDPPRLDAENAHLAELERLRGQSLEAASRDLQTLVAQVAEARAQLREEVSKVEAAGGSLEDAERDKRAQVERRREAIRSEQQTILAAIQSSQKIHLRDFIVRLQEDLTRGRERIRQEFGQIHGLDTVSMEVKVVPGVGGVGLHLPDPALRVDSARLSTLKLRFKVAPEEDEGEAKWATVPPLEGSTEEFARRKLAQAGFRVEAVYQEVAEATAEGRVLAQIYDARGTEAQLGSIVTLIVGQRQ